MDNVQMNKSSKAAQIRDAIQELGDKATYEQIRERVEAAGVSITPQQVSNERRKLRSRYEVEDLPVSVIRKVKELADELGSTSVVRRALDELEALTKSAGRDGDSTAKPGDARVT
jgi:hypothetical protein